MSRGSDDSALGLAAIALVAVVGGVVYAVWQFSKLIGVDLPTAFSMIGWAATLITVFGVCAYFRVFRWTYLIAGLIAGFWIALWPALNFWAANAAPHFYSYSSDEATSTIWWAAWYTKFGGLALIAAVAWLVDKWFGD